MMKRSRRFICVGIFVWVALHTSLSGEQGETAFTAMKKGGMGRNIRGLADTVGYAHTRNQMDAIIRICDSLDSRRFEEKLTSDDVQTPPSWIAGICPHDDYIYAAHVYDDMMRNLSAAHIILFGVAHRARNYNVADKLIFDTYEAWQGPYGAVRVSPLRENIIERLPGGSYTIHDELQSVEHSVEGLIPFLQYYNRDVQIVSILIPYMSWKRIDQLSRELAEVLSSLLSENNLVLGQNLAFLCSNDCVHYGDQGWGGKNYAPFGTDVEGYEQAVRRDQGLIDRHLIGTLDTVRLQGFFEQLVDQKDVTTYKITWCGRFSVPFGLNSLYYLMQLLQQPPLTGYLLHYDTSVASGELPVRGMGMGSTAPSNLRHWVGYCAIGYR